MLVWKFLSGLKEMVEAHRLLASNRPGVRLWLLLSAYVHTSK